MAAAAGRAAGTASASRLRSGRAGRHPAGWAGSTRGRESGSGQIAGLSHSEESDRFRKSSHVLCGRYLTAVTSGKGKTATDQAVWEKEKVITFNGSRFCF